MARGDQPDPNQQRYRPFTLARRERQFNKSKKPVLLVVRDNSATEVRDWRLAVEETALVMHTPPSRSQFVYLLPPLLLDGDQENALPRAPGLLLHGR